ncbi:hypothetical protein NIES2098_49080 [Calothrix sp. NIES-2098]|nr:hypothetical protein NIES2098_49080 [Calothrix sp. NIES-2098]
METKSSSVLSTIATEYNDAIAMLLSEAEHPK